MNLEIIKIGCKLNSCDIMKERDAKVELVVYEMGIANIYNQEH